jgi:hypothetical protein
MSNRQHTRTPSGRVGSATYNPATQPDAAAWLSWPEAERIRLVMLFHASQRIKLASGKAHAAMHVIVENQIASGFGPTVRAMDRLQQQGQARHEALHAVGAVVAEHLHALLSGDVPADAESSQQRLNAAIDALATSPGK